MNHYNLLCVSKRRNHMKVHIKEFDVEMELKNNGIELDIA